MKKIVFVGLVTTVISLSAGASSSNTMNVSASAVTFPSLQYDFKVSERSSVAPILGLSKYSAGANEATGLNFGLSFNHMLGEKVFSDGWSLNPRAIYYSVKSKDGSGVGGYSLSALIQRNWFWISGVNISAGVGVQYVSLDLSDIGLEISGVLPDLNLSLGYAF